MTYAQNQGSDYGCDHDIWRAMVNQAALETRRQDVMNKRYIVKADSVLQYSCFTDEVANTIATVAPIFSNGDHWVGREVGLLDGFATSMDIYNPNSPTEYGSPETPHGFDVRPLPGYDYRQEPVQYFFDALTPNTLEDALTAAVLEPYEFYIDGQFHHLVLSGTTPLESEVPSLCHPMAEVWRAAKCKNFDGVDIFYRFEELVSADDPREFPPSMPCEL